MEQKIKELIKELKGAGKSPFKMTASMEDPEAKVNVWYVIAKAEDVLLCDPKNNKVGPGLRTLIEELKKDSSQYPSLGPDPESKVNTWYVIARLSELLL